MAQGGAVEGWGAECGVPIVPSLLLGRGFGRFPQFLRYSCGEFGEGSPRDEGLQGFLPWRGETEAWGRFAGAQPLLPPHLSFVVVLLLVISPAFCKAPAAWLRSASFILAFGWHLGSGWENRKTKCGAWCSLSSNLPPCSRETGNSRLFSPFMMF